MKIINKFHVTFCGTDCLNYIKIYIDFVKIDYDFDFV